MYIYIYVYIYTYIYVYTQTTRYRGTLLSCLCRLFQPVQLGVCLFATSSLYFPGWSTACCHIWVIRCMEHQKVSLDMCIHMYIYNIWLYAWVYMYPMIPFSIADVCAFCHSPMPGCIELCAFCHIPMLGCIDSCLFDFSKYDLCIYMCVCICLCMYI